MKSTRHYLAEIISYAAATLLITATLAFGQPLIQSFLIDYSASSFSYDSWWNNSQNSSSHPLWGSFRMIVNDDPYFSYYGSPNLTFENIKVGSPQLPTGPFIFPNHWAHFDGQNLFGDDNLCNWLSPDTYGFCLSMGNFSAFTGTFDGAVLTLTGTSAVDWYSSYVYTIRAEVTSSVPEPATVTMVGVGMGLACLWRVRRKVRK